MRRALTVVGAAALLCVGSGRAWAQWIPPLSPATTAIGPDPVFAGVASPPAPGSVPASGGLPPTGTTGSLNPANGGIRMPSSPVIPDSTFFWLTVYGSPFSPNFVPVPPPPWRP